MDSQKMDKFNVTYRTNCVLVIIIITWLIAIAFCNYQMFYHQLAQTSLSCEDMRQKREREHVEHVGNHYFYLCVLRAVYKYNCYIL